MPAMLDDPTAPAIYRVSGPEPYPVPFGALPAEIMVRQVTLRDRSTMATLIPFSSPSQAPPKLTAFLCELLNGEIEKGDTYPMVEPMPLSSFAPYWFANFGAVMIMGDLQSVEDVAAMEAQGTDWSKACLGSFYVKPNYPGRSSHVCNGGFLVSSAARNRGVGRLMGECYLDWAPKLGYSYSVFNLVYETNVASLRIWDALGFKRIGRVKGCGNLKSYPDQFIDAIIFGRELGGEGDEYVSEERFDKIRFYLKTGTYPNGSDRAEKSRLRSAATHYRLIPSETGNDDDDVLMLKGKEVISDPHKQYEIARNAHASGHGGINKTTANIAEKYHWVRIKETVSAAIRNCSECKDPQPKSQASVYNKERRTPGKNNSNSESRSTRASATANSPDAQVVAGADATPQPRLPPPPPLSQHSLAPPQQQAPMANMQYTHQDEYADMPVDPQIMQSMQQWHSDNEAQHMHLSLDGAPDPEHPIDGEDVSARLREELEAQIMEDSQSFPGESRAHDR